MKIRKDKYEPVPEEVWEDVTGECVAEESATKGLRISHGGVDVGWHGGYRLRKVLMWDCPYGIHGIGRKQVAVFLIERKRPA